MHHRIAVLALAAATLSTAWAGAHFLRATGIINSDGAYVASFKEAGLGTGDITYLLSAGTAQSTFQCYTKSNNTPQGAPNSTVPSQLTTTGTFPIDKGGQITASLTLGPPAPTSDCQGGGLKLCLVSVSYQNVLLTDTTNQVSTGLPSRTESFLGPNDRPTNCEPF
jgi:hypothetical protein